MFWLVKPKYKEVYFAANEAEKEAIMNCLGGYFVILNYEPEQKELDAMTDYYYA